MTNVINKHCRAANSEHEKIGIHRPARISGDKGTVDVTG